MIGQLRDVQSVVLANEHVRLEPLQAEHAAELLPVALETDLWRWTIVAIRSPEEMSAYIASALSDRARGAALPFLIRHMPTGMAAGSTRFGNIEPAHRRLEIGWTWIGRDYRRTAMNTAAKFLMLRHAFETLGAARVEFKTDRLNEPSRIALVRIGAREEGTLRSHTATWRGTLRDTVYYSILKDEWPSVKARLESLLAARPVA